MYRWVRWLGGKCDFIESRSGERDLVAPDHVAVRIADLEIDGKSVERRLPIGSAGDHAEVGGFAGPVNAAIGNR